jgi:hypothetical protein
MCIKKMASTPATAFDTCPPQRTLALSLGGNESVRPLTYQFTPALLAGERASTSPRASPAIKGGVNLRFCRE